MPCCGVGKDQILYRSERTQKIQPLGIANAVLPMSPGLANIQAFQGGEGRQGRNTEPCKAPKQRPIQWFAWGCELQQFVVSRRSSWEYYERNGGVNHIYVGSVERLECFRVVDKVAELSSIEYSLLEGFYGHVFEKRGIDSGHNVLQILVIA